MKIIIPGGSGHVGTFLAKSFHAEGHQVVVLARKSFSAPWPVVEWDGRSLGPWKEELERADVVINLAGPQRQLPLRPEEPHGNHEFARRFHPRHRPSHPAGAPPAAPLAAGQHRHDLRASLRCRQRRVHRHPRRHRTERARHLALQHRRRPPPGKTPRARKPPPTARASSSSAPPSS